MSEEIEKQDEQIVEKQETKKKRKNRVVTEIIDKSIDSNEFIKDIKSLVEEAVKNAFSEVLVEKKREIFEPCNNNKKSEIRTYLSTKPKGKSRIRNVNVQMPVISKFKQFRSRRGKTGISTTFVIQSR